MAGEGSSPPREPWVREAVGVFADAGQLEQAVSELLHEEFQPDDLGLLAAAQSVKRLLPRHYRETGELDGVGGDACRAFVARDSDDSAVAAFGDLYFYGADTAAGAVVASAGVLGGAVGQVAAGQCEAAADGALMGLVLHGADAAHLEEQSRHGHLLLFVRTLVPELESRAVAVLLRHCTDYPKVYTVSARSQAARRRRSSRYMAVLAASANTKQNNA